MTGFPQEARPGSAIPLRLDESEMSHCRRVAALAVEVAQRLRLPEGTAAIVEGAALAHHFPQTLLEDVSLERLMIDLAGRSWRARYPQTGDETRASIREVVMALHEAPHEGRSPIRQCAEIVEIANIFCEHFEFSPYEHRTVDQILDEIRGLSEEELFLPETLHALSNLPRAHREELFEAAYRLPVFPGLALRAADPVLAEELDLQQLTEMATSDPDLAATILRVANSKLYSPTIHVTSIRDALRSIGLKASRQVLMTAVLRPYFQPAKNPDLWRHTLLVAQLSEHLAMASGLTDPTEAFLAGLVHDVGRVPFEAVTGEPGQLRKRMLDRGCETVFVEGVLSRFDHAELGANVLQRWNFPNPIVDAVRYHHKPELNTSPLVSLLYLAEYWSGSEEDVPSAYRMKVAMDRARIDLGVLQTAGSSVGLVDSLLGTAA